RVSPRKQTLWGLAVYQLDADFRLARLIEAESAVWDGARWQLVGARTLEFAAEGVRELGAAPPGFAIPATPADFRAPSVAAGAARWLFALVGGCCWLGGG